MYKLDEQITKRGILAGTSTGLFLLIVILVVLIGVLGCDYLEENTSTVIQSQSSISNERVI